MFMYVQWLFPRLSMALILHSKINPRGDLGVPLNARDIKIIQTNTKIQSRKFIDCNPYSMLRVIGIPWSTDHRPTTAIDHRHRFLPTTTLPRSGTPHKTMEKTQCFATFLPFRAPADFFFLSLRGLFPPLLFHPSILSEVWLLNFLRSLEPIQHTQRNNIPYLYVGGHHRQTKHSQNWMMGILTGNFVGLDKTIVSR